MGIKGLFQVLEKEAPDSFRNIDIKVLAGKIVTCDASNTMYAALAMTASAVQGTENNFELTDAQGNPTGHLIGLFNRTIAFIESGVRPIWVFDGKPPELKREELKRRAEAKKEAEELAVEAKETGDAEQIQKLKKRNIKITQTMSGDAKRMIKLMGIPVIEALSEAESQCVALVKAKKADAVASEDLDCLTFGAPMQIKGFTQRREKKDPVTELELDNVLKGLDLTMDEFIDFCILCGCDYVTSIHGLGPSGAFKLIKEHKTIEKALEVMRKDNEEKIKEDKKPKYEIPPESQFNYTAARAEFKACRALEIESSAVRDKLTQIEFGEPDEEGLKKFLCEEKQFSNARVESGLNKIKAAKKSGVQSSLESFFGKPTIIRSQQEKTKSGKKGAQKTKDKDGIKFSTKR